jgi:hypothetical protein
VRFAEANFTYTAPAGMEDDCGNLPCFRSPLAPTVSCWQFSLRQRLRLLFTGKLWLMVLMQGHPPVGLRVEKPEMKTP